MGIIAFIPAAGSGTRLKPLTDIVPKPLLPILGRPILDYVIDNVLELPIDNIGINLCHHGKQIKEWIESTGYAPMVHFFNEEKLLGTGGALSNAREFLEKGTFLVHNGDIVSGIDLLSFYEAHLRRRSLVTLAVDKSCTKEPFIGLDISGNVCAVRDMGDKAAVKRWVCYTGIAFYEPQFLDLLPEGVSDVRDYWMAAIKRGERISSYDIGGANWFDLGTIDSYASFVARELQLRGEERYIASPESVSVDCNIEGLCYIEDGVTISGQAKIKNSILLGGALVKENETVQNEVRMASVAVPIKSFKKDARITRDLDTLSGGSNRTYTVVSLSDDMKGVLLKTPPTDKEFIRQVEYARFFKEEGVAVPRILYLDNRRHRILFEDLGRTDLYELFHSVNNPNELIKNYYAAIDALVKFQSVNVSRCETLNKWLFGVKGLRWETDYFMSRFVDGFLGIKNRFTPDLLEEFNRLAVKVDGYAKTAMHRDYQSRNIMIRGTEACIVDFQGARMGAPAYDAASLIFDPYCPLPEDMEEDLLDYYIDKMVRGKRGSRVLLRESILYCALQRHMQALGAYGLLSKVKGKVWFNQHIPRALYLLGRESEQVKREYPAINSLVIEIMEGYK